MGFTLFTLFQATISGILLLHRRKGVLTSGCLWVYMLVSTFSGGINFYHALVDKESFVNDVEYVVDYVSFPFLVLLLFTCSFADFPSSESPTKYVSDLKDFPKFPSLREYASFPSMLTFWWFTPLAMRGFRSPLTTSDLYSLRESEMTHVIAPSFMKNWKQQERKTENGVKRRPGVVTTIRRTFGGYLLIGSFFRLMQDLLQVTAPLLLKWLLQFVQKPDEPVWHGFVIVFLLFLVSNIHSIFQAASFDRNLLGGLRIRSALVTMIYQKALCLKNSERKSTTVGEIVNLMAVDTERIRDLLTWFNLLWSSPLQISIAIYYIYRELGVAAFAGLAIMLCIIPINGWIAKISRKLQQKQMKQKDERVKTMSEILNGIKVIKLYAWEESFMNIISTLRNKEVQRLIFLAYLNATSIFLWTCAPFMVALLSFTVFVMMDDANVLDAEKTFVSLTCFNMLRIPLTQLPNLITSMIVTSVSVARLNRFLNAPELEKYVKRSKEGPALLIEDASFSWEVETDLKGDKKTKGKNPPMTSIGIGSKKSAIEVEEEAPQEIKTPITLEGINARVEKGSFTAIVGNVGAGKSSFLSALLGQIDKIKGKITVGAGIQSIAYVPQQAWIQNISLKENIRFGLKFDKNRYNQIIDVCELGPDLEMLPAGDETEIGENGINLSGGQKQRVNLARACYSNSDLYLMDDPLSAVDSHVAKNLFDKVLSSKTGILRNKTRILVTNNLSILPFVDQIIVISEGSISETGSYRHLMGNNGDFSLFVRQFSKKIESELKLDTEDVDSLHIQRTYSLNSFQDKTSLSIAKSLQEKIGKDKHLIQKERAKTGKVKSSIYLRYFKSVSTPWLFAVVIGMVGNSVSSGVANYWLSLWAQDDPIVTNGTVVQDTGLRNERLGVYAICGCLQGNCYTMTWFLLTVLNHFFKGVMIFLGAISLARGTIIASAKLHEGMLARVLRSPMIFFDTTPIGRVVNRFARDVDVVDATIPGTIRNLISHVLNITTTIVMIGIATPLFLILIIPIAVLYYLIQKFYIPTARQLKRLESITRSPIYSHFSETLAGVATIRAYSAEKRFIEESDARIDLNLSCFNCAVGSNRWLSIRLEFCGNCVIMFAALCSVLSKNFIDAGLIGLSMSYAMNITQTMAWLVRQTTQLETDVVSVERILEYSEIETERKWTVTPSKTKDTWPDQGIIEFKDYAVRYRPGLDLVIKDINIRIESKEKIGVVGRTGAGKSTITLSLFRIIEAAAGNITIDGVNICEIGLHDLRKKLTIIPQDPLLFSGSIRSNLDPFKEKTDDELWKCLHHAHLFDFVKSLPSGLETQVTILRFTQTLKLNRKQPKR